MGKATHRNNVHTTPLRQTTALNICHVSGLLTAKAVEGIGEAGAYCGVPAAEGREGGTTATPREHTHKKKTWEGRDLEAATTGGRTMGQVAERVGMGRITSGTGVSLLCVISPLGTNSQQSRLVASRRCCATCTVSSPTAISAPPLTMQWRWWTNADAPLIPVGGEGNPQEQRPYNSAPSDDCAQHMSR